MQVLGAKRKNLAGFSTASAQQHQGCVAICLASAPMTSLLWRTVLDRHEPWITPLDTEEQEALLVPDLTKSLWPKPIPMTPSRIAQVHLPVRHHPGHAAGAAQEGGAAGGRQDHAAGAHGRVRAGGMRSISVGPDGLTQPHGRVLCADACERHGQVADQMRRLVTGCSRWLIIALSVQDPSGAAGQAMADDMRKKIEKWQEPPPAKQTKVRWGSNLESRLFWRGQSAGACEHRISGDSPVHLVVRHCTVAPFGLFWRGAWLLSWPSTWLTCYLDNTGSRI